MKPGVPMPMHSVCNHKINVRSYNRASYSYLGLVDRGRLS